MKDRKREVLIVGGGPAGSFTALHLTEMCPELAGRITLIEARRQGRDKVCAGGVSGRVIRATRDDLGIDISSVPGKDSGGLILRYKDKEAVAEMPRTGRVIRRSVLDSFLLGKVRERGVEVLTETPVTGISRVPRGVTAETAAGGYTARVLVGADGMNGVTKKALGVPYGKPREYLYMVHIPDVEVPPMFMLDYSPTLSGVPGYMWVFPEDRGANAGITGGRPGGMGYLKIQFQRMLEKNLGYVLDGGKVKLEVYPERFFSFFNPSHAERVLFVGDNLGVAPMTGEGIGICMDSGKAAAKETLRALGTGDYSFKRYPWRLLAGDFFTTCFMETVLHYLKTPGFFNIIFMLATTENKPKGETFMDDFCRIFGGQIPSRSPAAWAALRKSLPTLRLLRRKMEIRAGAAMLERELGEQEQPAPRR